MNLEDFRSRITVQTAYLRVHAVEVGDFREPSAVKAHEPSELGTAHVEVHAHTH